VSYGISPRDNLFFFGKILVPNFAPRNVGECLDTVFVFACRKDHGAARATKPMAMHLVIVAISYYPASYE
jgi:hypothetical protein